MSFVVGVTGGIGSGKTAVTDYFASQGIVIVDADQAARVVVESDQPALKHIAARHNNILTPAGHLDRRKLREIIFADDAERVWLEQLLHPLIRDQIITEIKASKSPYTMLVSPLMIETDQHLLVNRILVIDVPHELQIERAMQRDGMTKEQTETIMAKQASRQLRLDRADDLVDNSGSLPQLKLRLKQLHRQYLHSSKKIPIVKEKG